MLMPSSIRNWFKGRSSAAVAKSTTPPGPGRVIEPGAVADLFVGELTPQRAKAILRMAACGEPREQNTLVDTMLETDGHLRSVYNTRRLAVTGLDWELLPANEVGKNPRVDEALATRCQEHCAEVLGELEGFEAAIRHLAEAVGRGTTVAQLTWESGLPVVMEPIEHHLLRGEASDPSRLRIVTRDNYTGIPLADYEPGQFLVHTPETIGGSRFRGGLIRASVLNYMAKRYAGKFWLICLELFAMAHAAGRLAEYEELGVAGWRFVANGESCPICSPVAGKVFALSDRRFFPPLHFWCDCEDEAVFAGELQDGEMQDSSRIANPALNKEQARGSGFKWDPAQYANLEALTLSRFPESLQPVFRAFAESHGWEIAA